MKVEVLGPGCAKCDKLYAKVQEAVRMSGMPVDVVKIEDIREIMSRGVAMTPALVVGGKVRSVGVVPETHQIVSWIMTAAMEAEQGGA